MVVTRTHHLETSGQGDTQDVTRLVAQDLAQSNLSEGIVTIAVIGSTAGMTTIEFEPGAVSDLNRVFEMIASRDGEYKHHLRWGDDNGSSHVRAALIGPSISKNRWALLSACRPGGPSPVPRPDDLTRLDQLLVRRGRRPRIRARPASVGSRSSGPSCELA